MPLQQMPAMSSAIRLTDNDMCMDFDGSLFNRDIPDQRQHFHLLVNRNSLVLLADRIEKAQDNIAECPDRREMTCK